MGRLNVPQTTVLDAQVKARGSGAHLLLSEFRVNRRVGQLA